VGLLVPFTDPQLIKNVHHLTSSASPFVIALKNAGIKILPAIMNSVILVTVLSVANSSVYGSSRVINAMADAGVAPKLFLYVDTQGRPIRCFYLALAFGCLSFLAQLKNETTVFLWLLALSGLSSIISWFSICITHLRFRKALRIHKIDVQGLPFRSPLGVIGSWLGIFCTGFIILVQFLTAVFPVGYSTMSGSLRAQSFFSSFMAFPIVFITFVMFKRYKGSELKGVSFSLRHGFALDNPHIAWGPGTSWVDLKKLDFRKDSWSLVHWRENARRNPDLLTAGDLWWLPKPWRGPFKRLYFPW
jgi:amino acid transporter